MALRTCWLKMTVISVQSEMTLEKRNRSSWPWEGRKARKPLVCRAAALSPVQRRLAGPRDQKLLSPSTLGVSDSAGGRRCRVPVGTVQVAGPLPSASDPHGHPASCRLGLQGLCFITGRSPEEAGTDPAMALRRRSDTALMPRLTPAAMCIRKVTRLALTAGM